MKRNKTIHHHKYSGLIKKLCLERKRLGLSQSEVAHSLKMTQSEVSKIETCERRIDIFEFKELLFVYRIHDNCKLQDIVMDFFELDMIKNDCKPKK